MNWVKGISSLLTTLDNFINFSYFDAIDAIKNDGIAILEAPEFQLSPLSGLDQYGPRGCHPLHYAIESRSQLAINWILSQSPPINSITEFEGWNPAHCAVIQENSETLLKLIELRVNLNFLDGKQLTPLAYAKSDLEFDNWRDQMLLNSPINWEIPLGTFRQTYLHFFAKDSTLQLLNYVIAVRLVAINLADRTGTTPLMLAAESGQIEAARTLILKDAKYDQVDEMGRMAIHRAAAAGQSISCKLLLFHPDVIKVDEIDDEFYTEIDDESIDCLKSRALLLIQDLNGLTPLMAAILNGHPETVRVLCSYPGHLNLGHPETGDTALHYAVQMNSPEMVSILLDASANPDPKNVAGLKPFDLASSNSSSEDPLKREIFLILADASL